MDRGTKDFDITFFDSFSCAVLLPKSELVDSVGR